MIAFLVIAFTLVLFLGMILLLASKPKYAGSITGTFIVIAAVGGLLFYGYGFAVTLDDVPLAIIRALINVCKMYGGAMDLGSIAEAPLMKQTWAQVLFWIIHLLALYATASAAITTVGAEALRKLRLWLARMGKLNLIYGVNEDTLNLGKKILARKDGKVVFIDCKPDTAAAAAIAKAGCVLRSDDSALRADQRFAKAIGANHKNRKIILYAMESSANNSQQYAVRFLKTLEDFGVAPENTGLVIRGQENSTAAQLQVMDGQYGYGSVLVVQEPNLAARVLIRNYPPCDAVSFDENALAREDFEAVIIGFGQVGQAVLRQLVMNGQFEGSTFRTAVFSPDCNQVKGPFCRNFPMVQKVYRQITFHPFDARSEQMYDYLEERGSNIKYLVVCTGSDRINQEIAENLTEFFQAAGMDVPVYLCTRRGVQAVSPDGKIINNHSLYRPEVLDVNTLDEVAMVVNKSYHGETDKSAAALWHSCDYFSRMSCRATADFIPAMLAMAGKTAGEATQEQGWNLTAEQRLNMSRTEHLRWCAFHYCMGYSPMPEQVHTDRCNAYLAQVQQGQTPLRITKDPAARQHACLVSWEELVTLAEKENAVYRQAYELASNKQARLTERDYQEEDAKNVDAVSALLKAEGKQ